MVFSVRLLSGKRNVAIRRMGDNVGAGITADILGSELPAKLRLVSLMKR